MKERPILFSAPMVRAILAGTKTQTRRPLYTMRKFFSTACFHRDYSPPPVLPPVGKCWALSNWRRAKPGDRIWVREAFMHEPADYCWEASVSIPCRPAHTVYRADFPECDQPQRGVKWSPSIHMPRNLSRILLEITAVRVERLNEITGADARAEGCPDKYVDGAEIASMDAMSREWYGQLWESINGAGSWAANPWVWVVEFKRVTP